MAFDYSLDFEHIDFRKHPEKYRVGKGEQGVLLVEPYKSEILPHWRFRTPDIAQESADAIYQLFNLQRKKRFCWNGHGAEISPNGIHAIEALRELQRRKEIQQRRRA